MSRSQSRIIERQSREISGLRAALAEARAEVRGMARGEHLVSAQLAQDIRLGAVREEQHRSNAARAYADLQTVLRSVAAHVLNVRGGCDTAAAAEALVAELTAAGVALRPALIAVQAELADASASEAAAAAAVSAP